MPSDTWTSTPASCGRPYPSSQIPPRCLQSLKLHFKIYALQPQLMYMVLSNKISEPQSTPKYTMATHKTHPNICETNMLTPLSLSAQEHIDSFEHELFALWQCQASPLSHTRVQKGKNIVEPETTKDTDQRKASIVPHHVLSRWYYVLKLSLLMKHWHYHQCHSQQRRNQLPYQSPTTRNQSIHSPILMMPVLWICWYIPLFLTYLSWHWVVDERVDSDQFPALEGQLLLLDTTLEPSNSNALILHLCFSTRSSQSPDNILMPPLSAGPRLFSYGHY